MLRIAGQRRAEGFVPLGSLRPQAQGARRVSASRYDIDESAAIDGSREPCERGCRLA